jgi:hypothetical protein
MSSGSKASLDPHQPVAERNRRISGWPWPLGVRCLIVLLVLAGALGLRLYGKLTGAAPQRSYRVAPILLVDANTAPAGVLESLPHVGPALVRRIIEQRTIRPFDSIADLRQRVRGLGPATLALLSGHLRIGTRGEPQAGPLETLGRSAPGGQRLAQGPRPPTSR